MSLKGKRSEEVYYRPLVFILGEELWVERKYMHTIESGQWPRPYIACILAVVYVVA